MNSLQALIKKGLLEGVTTCNLKFGKYCVLDKETKVRFGTAIHYMGGLLDCVDINVWGPIKTASLGSHRYFVSFVNDCSRHYWVYLRRQKFKILDLFMKRKKLIEN